jgi:hypothetical protein
MKLIILENKKKKINKISIALSTVLLDKIESKIEKIILDLLLPKIDGD